jgi:succinate-semialdehyde dehydrogenase / glutarate-semialdehyde dehydrogenase
MLRSSPRALQSVHSRFVQRAAFHSEVGNTDLIRTQGFINGKWTDAHDSKHFAVLDPSTDEEIARVANMGRRETLEAIAAAKDAQKAWKKTTPHVRFYPTLH